MKIIFGQISSYNVSGKKYDSKSVDNSCLHNSYESFPHSFTPVFTGTTRGEILRETAKTLDDIYSKYKESLMETPLKSIAKSVENITKETGSPKDEVLTAMQRLTQFADMRSVRKIGDTLKQYNVGVIGNTNNDFQYRLCCSLPDYNGNPKALSFGDSFVRDSGLHCTLDYLLNAKGISPLEPSGTSKIGIFLDEQNISNLENLKRVDKKSFKKFIKNPDIRCLMISGWDTGITIADRTKNLEEETKKLIAHAREKNISIDEAIDEPLLNRIHKLGINPVIIRNEGLANESTVYNQMKPERMTKNELFNIIDANTMIRTSENDTKDLLNKDAAANYLKETLSVYSLERCSQKLKELHTKVVEFTQTRGKTEDDIVYVVLDDRENTKSPGLINYFYKKVNNISDDKFVYLSDVNRRRKNINGEITVFIDDCIISGNSLESQQSAFNKKHFESADSMLYAYIAGSPKVQKRFNKCTGWHKQNKLLILDDIHSIDINKRGRNYENITGKCDYGSDEACSLIFPYMCPDNNVELAANIGLLHNVNYRTSNLMGQDKYIRTDGIKTIYKNTLKTTQKAKDLTGTQPVISELEIKSVKKANKKSLWTKFREIFDYY